MPKQNMAAKGIKKRAIPEKNIKNLFFKPHTPADVLLNSMNARLFLMLLFHRIKGRQGGEIYEKQKKK